MKKLVLGSALLLCTIPIAAHAQDEEFNPINPEYSGSEDAYYDYLYKFCDKGVEEACATLESLILKEMGASKEQAMGEARKRADIMKAQIEAALNEGYSPIPIIEYIKNSMYNREPGPEAMYACMAGYMIIAGAFSMAVGPAGPGVFFLGGTPLLIHCYIRHTHPLY